MLGLFKFLLSIPLIISFTNPLFAWKISEGWKYKKAEPSDAYLVMTRLMSVIFLYVLWFIIEI